MDGVHDLFKQSSDKKRNEAADDHCVHTTVESVAKHHGDRREDGNGDGHHVDLLGEPKCTVFVSGQLDSP